MEVQNTTGFRMLAGQGPRSTDRCACTASHPRSTHPVNLPPSIVIFHSLVVPVCPTRAGAGCSFLDVVLSEMHAYRLEALNEPRSMSLHALTWDEWIVRASRALMCFSRLLLDLGPVRYTFQCASVVYSGPTASAHYLRWGAKGP